MTFPLKPIAVLALLFMSCNTGKLTVVGSIDSDLQEASAAQLVNTSDLLWTIEDAGNKNNVYGMDLKGDIIRDIDISNIKNHDWEDLASDTDGNLYIGDFGNNSRKRKQFFIYKIENIANIDDKTNAKTINFTLPKNIKSEDFEAFFLWNDSFYVFSKENKKTMVIKIPNQIGSHEATYLTEYKLKGKDTRVTSADISPDGKTVVLLNHDRIWTLTNFKNDAFFDGTVQKIDLKHDSQKEGVCFKNNSTIYITDEDSGKEDNNIYSLKL
ncbi:SdiA-regulated domain-containing protein [Olleya sp. ITB9]|uniref:SdiA-regulated domain-containing protein n=1 Tax=Olleya sp. ITB9 TaxID=1715648 RepID=UPI0009E798FF|nr:SdiA-regulated domain-containing protein [Olleya sp. ITB9]